MRPDTYTVSPAGPDLGLVSHILYQIAEVAMDANPSESVEGGDRFEWLSKRIELLKKISVRGYQGKVVIPDYPGSAELEDFEPQPALIPQRPKGRPRYLTIAQVSECIGEPKRTVRNWVTGTQEDGSPGVIARLKSTRRNGSSTITNYDLYDWIAFNRRDLLAKWR